jgi:hypothetical protein
MKGIKIGKYYTRKEFLLSSPVTATTFFLLSPQDALADNTDDAVDIDIYIPDIAESRNDDANQMNRIALQKWEIAVIDALEEHSDIRLEPNQIEPTTLPYLCPVNIKTVSRWNIPCEIAFCAMYDISQERDGLIGEVFSLNAYAVNYGPDVEPVHGLWAKINSGKTLATLQTVNVTWDPGIFPAQTECFTFYIEYNTIGYSY